MAGQVLRERRIAENVYDSPAFSCGHIEAFCFAKRFSRSVEPGHTNQPANKTGVQEGSACFKSEQRVSQRSHWATLFLEVAESICLESAMRGMGAVSGNLARLSISFSIHLASANKDAKLLLHFIYLFFKKIVRVLEEEHCTIVGLSCLCLLLLRNTHSPKHMWA